jgi:LuxR family maltose regulon positive regulatory protein
LPWLTVQVELELTRAQLALGQVDEARLSLEHIATVLGRRPELGSLVADERELNDHMATASGAKHRGSVNLTAAELRLLPYLATHLTFPEIAAELFVTRHTIRSQAKAIYAKFEATSRSQAIERAVQIGLLESILPYLAGVAV